MEAIVRQAVSNDRNAFVDLTVKLSKFNRCNHAYESKNDDYNLVLNSVQGKAEETFSNRNKNTLILIAEIEGKPVGYALSRIFQQYETADNGTGLMGLFDEIYVDTMARGFGLGQKLLDETIKWMKGREIDRVKLYAYTWNKNAKNMYEKNGFKGYAVSYEKFI
ncbi:GNAT family N-acetyltransferase [Mycoplasmatota bacterium zrk1]